MKRCLKMVLSLALVLVLAGSLSGTVFAHSGHYSRRAKVICRPAYTTNRQDTSAVTGNGAAADSTANGEALANTAPAAAAVTPETVPEQAPIYAACYENGYCTGNNLCDVNGVCQNGGNCYGPVNQNQNAGNGSYGHHGGGHHGGRHH